MKSRDSPTFMGTDPGGCVKMQILIQHILGRDEVLPVSQVPVCCGAASLGVTLGLVGLQRTVRLENPGVPHFS